MMLVASRALVFLLLAVDWAEDTHFGTYIFSSTYASTPVSSLDLGFPDEALHCDCDKEHEGSLAIGAFPCTWGAPCFAGQEARFNILTYAADCLYLFMSLQQ